VYVPSQLNLWLVVPLDKLRRELPRAQRGRQRRLNALHVRPQSVHDVREPTSTQPELKSTFLFIEWTNYGIKLGEYSVICSNEI